MEDTGKYSSPILAKYLWAYGNEKGYYMNMTKVQKLLFISYGLFLAWRNCRLVDEHPQAWPYGPVFPTTRNKLLKVNLDKLKREDSEFDSCRTDDDLERLLASVFKRFGGFTANQLVDWTHMDNSPWDKTRMKDGFKWGERIQDEVICDYFKSNLLNPNLA